MVLIGQHVNAIPGYHENIPMGPPQMMGWHPNDPSGFFPMDIPATPQNSPVKGIVSYIFKGYSVRDVTHKIPDSFAHASWVFSSLALKISGSA